MFYSGCGDYPDMASDKKTIAKYIEDSVRNKGVLYWINHCGKSQDLYTAVLKLSATKGSGSIYMITALYAVLRDIMDSGKFARDGMFLAINCTRKTSKPLCYISPGDLFFMQLGFIHKLLDNSDDVKTDFLLKLKRLSGKKFPSVGDRNLVEAVSLYFAKIICSFVRANREQRTSGIQFCMVGAELITIGGVGFDFNRVLSYRRNITVIDARSYRRNILYCLSSRDDMLFEQATKIMSLKYFREALCGFYDSLDSITYHNIREISEFMLSYFCLLTESDKSINRTTDLLLFKALEILKELASNSTTYTTGEPYEQYVKYVDDKSAELINLGVATTRDYRDKCPPRAIVFFYSDIIRFIKKQENGYDISLTANASKYHYFMNERGYFTYNGGSFDLTFLYRGDRCHKYDYCESGWINYGSTLNTFKESYLYSKHPEAIGLIHHIFKDGGSIVPVEDSRMEAPVLPDKKVFVQIRY